MRSSVMASSPSMATWFASILVAMPQLASAFYLPGVAPTSYQPSDKVPLNVNAIKPIAQQQDALLHSVLSYDYYSEQFHFCQPADEPKPVAESLGSILFGDRIMTSPLELKIGVNETCKPLCSATYSADDAKFINERIMQGYALNWLVDSLPAGQRIIDEMTDTEFYSPGFAMGTPGRPADETGAGELSKFHNHYDIVIDYHKVNNDPNQLRVVGALVQPSSFKYEGEPNCADGHPPVVLDENEGAETTVQFSYGVYWIESPTAWATRWDKYLHVYDPKIHWFSLVNSAVVVIFLVVTVASVLFRALKKDIARYNRLDSFYMEDFSGGGDNLEDGVQEDSGWKLVHGDVFRPPSRSLLLSVFLGNGAQLFVMTGLTICFALLGFLSPSNRGSLGTIAVFLYTLLSFVGGYTSARVYKSLSGDKWKLNIILTPLLVPGIVFATFFLLDLFLWANQAAGAVPFTTMLVIIAIWFVISLPLSVAGSWLGFRAKIVEPPVRTNQIPRQIPPVTTYLKPIPSMLLVGVLPFGAIFVELYFIMSSIWFSKIYYMFGFLFLCFGLMIITCAAVTVLLVYFLLCAENYNWQWRAFLAAGASAGYVFANALVYLMSKLSLGGLSGIVLYMGYSALISFLFFILTGSIGFFASWWFVYKIYGSIKVE